MASESSVVHAFLHLLTDNTTIARQVFEHQVASSCDDGSIQTVNDKQEVRDAFKSFLAECPTKYITSIKPDKWHKRSVPSKPSKLSERSARYQQRVNEARRDLAEPTLSTNTLLGLWRNDGSEVAARSGLNPLSTILLSLAALEKDVCRSTYRRRLDLLLLSQHVDNFRQSLRETASDTALSEAIAKYAEVAQVSAVAVTKYRKAAAQLLIWVEVYSLGILLVGRRTYLWEGELSRARLQVVRRSCAADVGFEARVRELDRIAKRLLIERAHTVQLDDDGDTFKADTKLTAILSQIKIHTDTASEAASENGTSEVTTFEDTALC